MGVGGWGSSRPLEAATGRCDQCVVLCGLDGTGYVYRDTEPTEIRYSHFVTGCSKE